MISLDVHLLVVGAFLAGLFGGPSGMLYYTMDLLCRTCDLGLPYRPPYRPSIKALMSEVPLSVDNSPYVYKPSCRGCPQAITGGLCRVVRSSPELVLLFYLLSVCLLSISSGSRAFQVPNFFYVCSLCNVRLLYRTLCRTF